MNVLGVSAFYHDSAAALVRDGEVIVAAQEERFSRIRHDEGFPSNAVRYCLDAGDERQGHRLFRITMMRRRRHQKVDVDLGTYEFPRHGSRRREPPGERHWAHYEFDFRSR
jgi:predicted NodU family carbamoyl transferase